MRELHRITPEDTALIEKFLSIAGSSLDSFRYFARRPLEIIANHVVTYILTVDGVPACYGHLDREDGIVWLGIAVAEGYLKKGLGSFMMDALLARAREEGLVEIRLAVDNDNEPAQSLYRMKGFTLLEKKDRFSFYSNSLS